MMSALIADFVLIVFFLLVILESTSPYTPNGFADIAIGFALVLIHLISIPIKNTSVNPVRFLSQALFADGAYLSQVWLFWVASIAGAIVGGLIHSTFFLKTKSYKYDKRKRRNFHCASFFLMMLLIVFQRYFCNFSIVFVSIISFCTDFDA
jgi:hypothetical protein